jgi:hypothetical protein
MLSTRGWFFGAPLARVLGEIVLHLFQKAFDLSLGHEDSGQSLALDLPNSQQFYSGTNGLEAIKLEIEVGIAFELQADPRPYIDSQGLPIFAKGSCPFPDQLKLSEE